MTNRIHIWPKPIIKQDGLIVVSATIEVPGRDRWQLWYRMPEAYSDWITKSADPFLLGVLFTAMQSRQDVQVHGTISPSLLRNLDEFQKAWSLWRPERYQRVDLFTDCMEEQPSNQELDAVLGFSGGCDSAFSAWIHRPDQAGPISRRLAAGLMIHGFDIPVEETETFELAADKSRRMLDSIGIQLLSLSTNLREQHNNWDDFHGAALAACLMLFQGKFRTGLIASSYPYNNLILPYGSNPITDRLLSNDSFTIVHDGAAYTKVEKICIVSHWPEARQYLRVCWEGQHKDRNCCRCQKCTWTMMVFRAIGEGLPPCFSYEITDQEIRHLKYSDIPSLNSVRRQIKWLKTQEFQTSTIHALKISALANQIRFAGRRFPLLKRLILRVEPVWFHNPNPSENRNSGKSTLRKSS